MALGDDVNPMMPGTKLFCIYGFCDIRNFTDATEVLQEGVMLFFNEIGGIVHEIIDSYSGAANKNIGDAFLLVWKLEEQDMVRDKKTGDVQAKKCQRVAQLADMSLLSFIILIAALKKSRKMTKYNIHKGLNERMPGYQVKLGLGLHMGYSIEGALGSYYKIDATYLSPHVNMAARLEGATKAFGVPLLVH
jgi:class 3 adenylate cyclase